MDNLQEKNFKSGFVAIIGRPNVGKSSLLNSLIQQKVSIISQIPQTTRHQIRGVLNIQEAQVIFVDTPGIHNFKDQLTLHLNTVAKRALEGIDLIIYVVDTSRPPGNEEKRVLDMLTGQKQKIIMVLNKIDLEKKYFNDYIKLWDKAVVGKKSNPLLYYIPASAAKGKNIDKIKDAILENLPQGPAYYDQKTLTDFPLTFRLADIIREKLFLKLKNELPHSLAVEIEEVRDNKRSIYIKANIYVQRKSQKTIVVGKKGFVLKEVGVACRKDIEMIFGKKSYLDIWVTVLSDWQKSPRILKKLGYWWA
ncbi:MAG: GTPase Era [Candidatus Omnitrophica bacterium]|nr:GTPase Era [Candidatus Omnitrophota bacterium]